MTANWRDVTNVLASIGAYDDVHAEVQKIRPGMAFVDIGANAGVFSMVAGKRVGPAGAVIAFEPSLSVFANLSENAKLNALSNFFPFMVAIGPETGLRSFARPNMNHSGVAHLSTDGEDKVLQLGWSSLGPLFSELLGEREVMIKIDVEGAEAQVLATIAPLLADRKTRTVIVEIDAGTLSRFGDGPSVIYDLMASHGYSHTYGLQAGSHFNEVFTKT